MKDPVTIIHVTDGRSAAIDLPSGGDWRIRSTGLDDIASVEARDSDVLLVDADLRDDEIVRKLRAATPAWGADSIRVFICDRDSRLSRVRAAALHATRIMSRPVDVAELLQYLSTITAPPLDPGDACTASISTGGIVLRELFDLLLKGERVKAAKLFESSEDISNAIRDAGVDRWLAIVRHHHAGTTQHCLLVTGVANAFAGKLGLSRADTASVTVACLVHDIGKARIPLDILDKPGKLTDDEFELMKMHPIYADEFLLKMSDLNDDIRDAARHHHEYLDGSGYPDGLTGAQIRDMTRIVVICDIFGALIERRSYRQPVPSPQAYGVLLELADQGKIEKPLVAAFQMVADEVS